jgi:NADH-quinone oxidoreductase subunit L
MVTAGVYMVARMNLLYSLSGTAAQIVATVGAVTAVYAATMALTQNDIKRVLAYSTISQIGYMFIGCGVGAYAAGMFHLYSLCGWYVPPVHACVLQEPPVFGSWKRNACSLW